MKNKNFDGFYGLRFIAICVIIAAHLFTFKSNFGLSIINYPVLYSLGNYALEFFFVASSFLITYLLLAEYKATGSLSIKYFFLRRILRIWPAYYLLITIVLIGLIKIPFFTIPGITDKYLAGDANKSGILYFTFLPHLVPFFNSTSPYLHHTYTLGIEEQFYIVWGILVFFLRKKIALLSIVIVISMPVLNVLHSFLHSYSQQNPVKLAVLVNKAITYLNYSKVSTFAVGAFFGYSYFYERNWLLFFRNKGVQIVIYTVLLLSIVFSVKPLFFYTEYMSFIMACLMMTASFKDSLVSYQRKWLVYLGNISYGIYLFHIIAIVLVVKFFAGVMHWQANSVWQQLLLFLTTLALSTFFGWLSYNYFELYFLKLKQRLRKVNTAHE